MDYPTIQITTLYPGASPEVIASSITAPLEKQFGQMPGLEQMWSTSSGGASVVTLRFAFDETDVAEQQVQAAINAASHPVAERSAGTTGVQQGQPGGRADPPRW